VERNRFGEISANGDFEVRVISTKIQKLGLNKFNINKRVRNSWMDPHRGQFTSNVKKNIPSRIPENSEMIGDTTVKTAPKVMIFGRSRGRVASG